MVKALSRSSLPSICRKEATRTPDPYVPNVVRYQLRYFPPFCGCKDTHFPKKCQIFCVFFPKLLGNTEKSSIFAPAFKKCNVGAIAQLVEQRTENPCVPGSIPGGTTTKKGCTH